MSFFHYLLLVGSTCLLFISVSQAVPLDANCSGAIRCDGNETLVCRDGRCQCNVPWFRPCNNTCEVNQHISYEGQTCIVQRNCVPNANCTGRVCRCLTNYVPINGICLKALNTTCAAHAECWSQNCVGLRCQCLPYHENRGDNARCRTSRCSRWSQANATNQTCWDSNACIDVRASCINATRFIADRYCKCPEGYRADETNTRCVAWENALLSPLDSPQSEYPPCGYCRDDNAGCMKAANRTTCWCRAGFGRIEGGCVNNRKMQPPVIYPNWNDTAQLHNFEQLCGNISNYTNVIEKRFCSCGPQYEFVATDQRCALIQRVWIDSMYEYGLCTRINARHQAISEQGLCPLPFKCESRQDKYVCSCGKNRFQSLDDSTLCIHYIDVPTSGDNRCPRNADYNATSNRCQCERGYEPVNENRQCQRRLSPDTSTSSCITDRTYDDVCRVYGGKAILCRFGECRCSGEQSFPNENQTGCYAPVEQELIGALEQCPEYSYLNGRRCSCRRGYQASSDSRRCDPAQAILSEYLGDPNSDLGGFNEDDCRQVFSGPVIVYANLRCQCDSESFVNNASRGCWHRLNLRIIREPKAEFCPPHSLFDSDPICKCDNGYEARGDECFPLTDRVYDEDDPSVPNIDGLNNAACENFFGTAARISSTGRFCTCKNQSYPVFDYSYCHFLVNTPTDNRKYDLVCPRNSKPDLPTGRYECRCLLGYYPSSDYRDCELSNLTLSGAELRNMASSCNGYYDYDCVAKFGEYAFCRNNTCYCDRYASFINVDDQCEPFSKYVFPGIHERNYYTCDTDRDCGEQRGVECSYLYNDWQYKVCQCKIGWMLDPRSQLCVEFRCRPECDASRNFECRGYQCVCRAGYYYNGTQCVMFTYRRSLDQVCNRTLYGLLAAEPANEGIIQCNGTCQRVQCIPGYRPEGAVCVPYQLERDPCLFRANICSLIDTNSLCNSQENVCSCGPAYYQYGDRCARSIDTRCVHDEDCGGGAVCRGHHCRCVSQQRAEQVTDIYGRAIFRCVNNGVDPRRLDMWLSLFFVVGWALFA